MMTSTTKEAPSSNWKALSQKWKKTTKATKRVKPTAAKSTFSKTPQEPLGADDAATTKTKTTTTLDIWFDDVDMEMIQSEKKASLPAKAFTATQVTEQIDMNKTKLGKYIAIDCEMVGVGPDGKDSALARVTVVNYHGAVVLDRFVRPQETVTDYRTTITGITAKHLRDAHDFKNVQKQVAELMKGRIVVGHALQNDFQALLLEHPRKMIRDTARYPPFRKAYAKGRTPALRKLAKHLLQKEIQSGHHCPVEDAQVALMLYKLHKDEWETFVTKKQALNVKQRSIEKDV